jgi:hypothetical protein
MDISVKPARDATFAISLRIPGWCRQPELSVNGSTMDAVPDERGFVHIERLWKAGDAIHLRFPMSVRVETGRDQNAHDAPYASVSYGPLLFALPIADTQDPNTPDPNVNWKYALDVPGDAWKSDVRVERQAMPDVWNWPLEATLKLQIGAVACDWTPSPENPLPAGPASNRASRETVTLIPYGCTKFRISMFPVTERAWKMFESEGRDEQRE